MDTKQISMLRHEIHQPCIALRGTLDVVIHELGEIEEGLEIKDSKLLSKIMEIKDRIELSKSYALMFSTIIENVFLSLDQNQTIIYSITNFSIKDILLNAQNIFLQKAIHKNIEYKNINFDQIKIEGDRSLLLRVFVIIYNNAIKYSSYGNKKPQFIETKIEQTNEYINISISNLGVGILSEEMKNIFEMGYRGILSSDRHRTGSGLGLYLVKKLVSSHHGDVSIASKPLSENIATGPYLTEITIKLPYIFSGR